MKLTNREKIKIFGVAAPILIGFIGLLTYTNLTKVNVAGNGNATAVGTNAQATVTNNIAQFSWTNQSSWHSNQTPYGYFSTELLFSADSQILPHRVCVNLKTDAEIQDLRPAGASFNISSLTSTHTGNIYTYLRCFEGEANLITLNMLSNKSPKIIQAQIVNQ